MKPIITAFSIIAMVAGAQAAVAGQASGPDNNWVSHAPAFPNEVKHDHFGEVKLASAASPLRAPSPSAIYRHGRSFRAIIRGRVHSNGDQVDKSLKIASISRNTVVYTDSESNRYTAHLFHIHSGS